MNCDKHENGMEECGQNVHRKGGKHESEKVINGKHVSMKAGNRERMKAYK